MSEQAKHLYGNAVDTYVATSLEEAFALGIARGVYDDDEAIEYWRQLPDGLPLSIVMVLGRDGKPLDFVLPSVAFLEDEDPDDGQAVFVARNGEWAEANPIGFLCSTEY